MARQLVERVSALRPDTQVSAFVLNSTPDEYDRVLDSLIQFDIYWCVAAAARTGRDWDQYPSAAAFYARRASPAFERLITDDEARTLVLADDADNLEEAITIVVETAQSISWNSYHRPWDIRESTIVTGYFASQESGQEQ